MFQDKELTPYDAAELRGSKECADYLRLRGSKPAGHLIPKETPEEPEEEPAEEERKEEEKVEQPTQEEAKKREDDKAEETEKVPKEVQENKKSQAEESDSMQQDDQPEEGSKNEQEDLPKEKEIEKVEKAEAAKTKEGESKETAKPKEPEAEAVKEAAPERPPVEQDVEPESRAEPTKHVAQHAEQAEKVTEPPKEQQDQEGTAEATVVPAAGSAVSAEKATGKEEKVTGDKDNKKEPAASDTKEKTKKEVKEGEEVPVKKKKKDVEGKDTDKEGKKPKGDKKKPGKETKQEKEAGSEAKKGKPKKSNKEEKETEPQTTKVGKPKKSKKEEKEAEPQTTQEGKRKKPPKREKEDEPQSTKEKAKESNKQKKEAEPRSKKEKGKPPEPESSTLAEEKEKEKEKEKEAPALIAAAPTEVAEPHIENEAETESSVEQQKVEDTVNLSKPEDIDKQEPEDVEQPIDKIPEVTKEVSEKEKSDELKRPPDVQTTTQPTKKMEVPVASEEQGMSDSIPQVGPEPVALAASTLSPEGNEDKPRETQITNQESDCPVSPREGTEKQKKTNTPLENPEKRKQKFTSDAEKLKSSEAHKKERQKDDVEYTAPDGEHKVDSWNKEYQSTEGEVHEAPDYKKPKGRSKIDMGDGKYERRKKEKDDTPRKETQKKGEGNDDKTQKEKTGTKEKTQEKQPKVSKTKSTQKEGTGSENEKVVRKDTVVPATAVVANKKKAKDTDKSKPEVPLKGTKTNTNPTTDKEKSTVRGEKTQKDMTGEKAGAADDKAEKRDGDSAETKMKSKKDVNEEKDKETQSVKKKAIENEKVVRKDTVVPATAVVANKKKAKGTDKSKPEVPLKGTKTNTNLTTDKEKSTVRGEKAQQDMTGEKAGAAEDKTEKRDGDSAETKMKSKKDVNEEKDKETQSVKKKAIENEPIPEGEGKIIKEALPVGDAQAISAEQSRGDADTPKPKSKKDGEQKEATSKDDILEQNNPNADSETTDRKEKRKEKVDTKEASKKDNSQLDSAADSVDQDTEEKTKEKEGINNKTKPIEDNIPKKDLESDSGKKDSKKKTKEKEEIYTKGKSKVDTPQKKDHEADSGKKDANKKTKGQEDISTKDKPKEDKDLKKDTKADSGKKEAKKKTKGQEDISTKDKPKEDKDLKKDTKADSGKKDAKKKTKGQEDISTKDKPKEDRSLKKDSKADLDKKDSKERMKEKDEISTKDKPKVDKDLQKDSEADLGEKGSKENTKEEKINKDRPKEDRDLKKDSETDVDKKDSKKKMKEEEEISTKDKPKEDKAQKKDSEADLEENGSKKNTTEEEISTKDEPKKDEDLNNDLEADLDKKDSKKKMTEKEEISTTDKPKEDKTQKKDSEADLEEKGSKKNTKEKEEIDTKGKSQVDTPQKEDHEADLEREDAKKKMKGQEDISTREKPKENNDLKKDSEADIDKKDAKKTTREKEETITKDKPKVDKDLKKDSKAGLDKKDPKKKTKNKQDIPTKGKSKADPPQRDDHEADLDRKDTEKKLKGKDKIPTNDMTKGDKSKKQHRDVDSEKNHTKKKTTGKIETGKKEISQQRDTTSVREVRSTKQGDEEHQENDATFSAAGTLPGKVKKKQPITTDEDLETGVGKRGETTNKSNDLDATATEEVYKVEPKEEEDVTKHEMDPTHTKWQDSQQEDTRRQQEDITAEHVSKMEKESPFNAALTLGSVEELETDTYTKKKDYSIKKKNKTIDAAEKQPEEEQSAQSARITGDMPKKTPRKDLGKGATLGGDIKEDDMAETTQLGRTVEEPGGKPSEGEHEPRHSGRQERSPSSGHHTTRKEGKSVSDALPARLAVGTTDPYVDKGSEIRDSQAKDEDVGNQQEGEKTGGKKAELEAPPSSLPSSFREQEPSNSNEEDVFSASSKANEASLQPKGDDVTQAEESAHKNPNENSRTTGAYEGTYDPSGADDTTSNPKDSESETVVGGPNTARSEGDYEDDFEAEDIETDRSLTDAVGMAGPESPREPHLKEEAEEENPVNNYQTGVKKTYTRELTLIETVKRQQQGGQKNVKSPEPKTRRKEKSPKSEAKRELPLIPITLPFPASLSEPSTSLKKGNDKSQTSQKNPTREAGREPQGAENALAKRRKQVRYSTMDSTLEPEEEREQRPKPLSKKQTDSMKSRDEKDLSNAFSSSQAKRPKTTEPSVQERLDMISKPKGKENNSRDVTQNQSLEQADEKRKKPEVNRLVLNDREDDPLKTKRDKRERTQLEGFDYKSPEGRAKVDTWNKLKRKGWEPSEEKPYIKPKGKSKIDTGDRSERHKKGDGEPAEQWAQRQPLPKPKEKPMPEVDPRPTTMATSNPREEISTLKKRRGKRTESRPKSVLDQTHERQEDDDNEWVDVKPVRRRKELPKVERKTLKNEIQELVRIFEAKTTALSGINRSRKLTLYHSYRGGMTERKLVSYLKHDYNTGSREKSRADFEHVQDWERYLAGEFTVVHVLYYGPYVCALQGRLSLPNTKVRVGAYL